MVAGALGATILCGPRRDPKDTAIPYSLRVGSPLWNRYALFDSDCALSDALDHVMVRMQSRPPHPLRLPRPQEPAPQLRAALDARLRTSAAASTSYAAPSTHHRPARRGAMVADAAESEIYSGVSGTRRRIIMMRHAESEGTGHGVRDHDRAITTGGRTAAQQVGSIVSPVLERLGLQVVAAALLQTVPWRVHHPQRRDRAPRRTTICIHVTAAKQGSPLSKCCPLLCPAITSYRAPAEAPRTTR